MCEFKTSNHILSQSPGEIDKSANETDELETFGIDFHITVTDIKSYINKLSSK